MALQQIIQHETGAYSQYWRIVNTNLDYENLSGEIVLWGYVNQEARENGKTRLDKRTFTVQDPDFTTYFIPSAIDPQDINQVKNSYLYIKGISGGEFSTATDV